MKKFKKSKRHLEAKRYPKSSLVGKPCFGKTIYPTEAEGEKGATIIWSKDPTANRSDLHAYRCPDGCKGFHAGHKSYYTMHLERQESARSHV